MTAQTEGVKAGHTKGEWGVEDPMDHCLTIVANPRAPVYDWVWVATCDWPDEDNHLITAAEVKANARLIASAPDLLEALQWVTTSLEQAEAGYPDPRADQAVALARAAIAKALGQ